MIFTNNHVLDTPEAIKKAKFEFFFQPDCEIITTTAIDGLFATNKDLDFTIVLIKFIDGLPHPIDVIKDVQSLYIAKGQRCNIIGHPNAGYKQISIQKNKIVGVYGNVIRYTTDTQVGSSGSPIFNNQWQLIGIHHSTGESIITGKKTTWVSNEGTHIGKILDYLNSNHKNIYDLI